MSQSLPRNVTHSLSLVKPTAIDAARKPEGKCGGDCSNCPCSGESPKSPKKIVKQEVSDGCDKC